ncbi:hypothetical protein_gp078 [Bacillus phage vB_BceM_WH1]|nr:hypothetical protein_gp078 [Bacillus phage vB_BceM_WH1]
MPQYGRFRYGTRYKYGKYATTTKDPKSIGPHIQYRIRSHSKGEIPSDFARMIHERIEINENFNPRIRIRANDGTWVYLQEETIPAQANHIRMRAVGEEPGPWVHHITTTVEREENK